MSSWSEKKLRLHAKIVQLGIIFILFGVLVGGAYWYYLSNYYLSNMVINPPSPLAMPFFQIMLAMIMIGTVMMGLGVQNPWNPSDWNNETERYLALQWLYHKDEEKND